MLHRRWPLVLVALILIAAGVLLLRQRRITDAPAPAAGARDGGAGPGRKRPERMPSKATLTDGGAGRTTTLVKGRWGAAPGEFGRKRDPESAPEAPMSLAPGPKGQLLVLDQQNGRIQRFDAQGKPAGEVRVGADTFQDVAVDPKGNVLVLDRLADGEVAIYDAEGRPKGRVPVVGGPITEGGGVTGLFADERGVWLEREHGEVVRIADAEGRPDPNRPTQPGRPSRDGQLHLWARIASAPEGTVLVRAFDRDGQVRWQRRLGLERPIAHLLLLDTDRRGSAYLGALTGRPTEEGLAEATIVVVRAGLADGQPTGRLVLPAPEVPEEMFRELSVTDDGEILQLLPRDDGMSVLRHVFGP